jgi:ABC-2 type transport system permease protein
VGALYELFFAFELVLSGRLVPMPLMPAWVQTLASYLPFQWTFFFPIEALVGSLAPAELLRGLAMQLLWMVIGTLAVNVLWKFGIRRFSAVGN